MHRPAREGRLARPEPALEANHIAALEHSRKGPRQGERVSFGLQLELQHAQALSHHRAPCTLGQLRP